MRGERGGATLVEDLAIHQDARRACIHIDRPCRIKQEIDLNHPVRSNRVRMGGETTHGPLILIGIGFLAIPRGAHIVICLLPIGGIRCDDITRVGVKCATRFRDIRKFIVRQADTAISDAADITGVEIIRIRDQFLAEDLRDRRHRNIIRAQINDAEPAFFLPARGLAGP